MKTPAVRSLARLAAVSLAVVASACDTPRILQADATDAVADGGFAPSCSACHGTDGNPAPPRAVGGKVDVAWRGVGAHQTHVVGTASADPVACASCHVVPTGLWDEHHIDSPDKRATVTFGGAALFKDATPTWSPTDLTCATTYCHGGTLKAPGTNGSPLWTLVDGSQRGCGSCHGAPPPKPHPQTGDCIGCHAATAGPKNTIAHKDKHINGVVEVVFAQSVACNGCHGAPPANSVKGHPQLGQCELCHAQTAGPGQTIATAANHMNGKVEVAVAEGQSCGACHGSPPPPSVKNHPQSDACEACHAQTAGPGGTIADPLKHRNGKVEVQLSAAAPCGACHGAPPPVGVKNHPQDQNCEGCHAATAGTKQTIAFADKHMDGKVQVQLPGVGAPCAGCHGAPPPKSVQNHPQHQACEGCHAGSVGPNRSLVAGGKHLNGKVDLDLAPLSAPCGACHGSPPPKSINNHPQHSQCDGCHASTAGPNQTLAGPGHLNGKVDVVLGANAPCGACHGAPPPPAVKNHPQNGNCEGCHAATAGPGQTIANPANHRNGKVDIDLGSSAPCQACHGLPPTDKHPAMADCNKCHAAAIDAQGKLLPGGAHYNGKVDFSLGSAACDACHGAPPNSASHPKAGQCSACHPATATAAGQLVPKGGHVNGKVDVALPQKCDACHGSNGSAAPPPDVNGKSDPTLPTVGAHAAHLQGKQFGKGGMACTACHVLPQTVGQPGHLQGTLASVSFPDWLAHWKGATPAWDKATLTCNTVYCHGATLDGGTVPAPVWNQPGLLCGACHGLPPSPASGHPTVDASKGTQVCNTCHGLTVLPDGTIDQAGGWHINGMVNP
ncbi:MAG: CxxxxCH/CxxCH domain-containing protein [Deltaproteobacteria bacterium]|nr:CxxxxCH/CxxCH domain-containing protein [Deltaproteobacteria bacterium]